jgi:chromosome segregation ATPase
MVEPMMYFGIGFLAAALLAALFIPLVHNRAVRLTTRRLNAAMPLSIAEIRADKDQLRAEFAMSTRRLELSVEQMKAKATAQLAELGKKADVVNQLKKELEDKTAAMFALEARHKSLQEQIRVTELELEAKSSGLAEAERSLADKEAEFGRVTASLGDQSDAADSQRLELAALRTQVEALKVSITDYESAIKQTEERLTHERSESAAAGKDLAAARSKLDEFGARKAELEQNLSEQSKEAEWLGKRVQELEARLADQGRLLAERDYEIERLRSEAEAARRAESDLRSELAMTGNRGNAATEKFRGDIDQLEAQLASALEQRNKLQSEISAMKMETESTWASERVENALLRERINDIAAEVARLTAALEGPGSPIDAILATAGPTVTRAFAGPGMNGRQPRGEAAPAGIEPAKENKSSLADRIRALQASASRAAQSN